MIRIIAYNIYNKYKYFHKFDLGQISMNNREFTISEYLKFIHTFLIYFVFQIHSNFFWKLHQILNIIDPSNWVFKIYLQYITLSFSFSFLHLYLPQIIYVRKQSHKSLTILKTTSKKKTFPFYWERFVSSKQLSPPS